MGFSVSVSLSWRNPISVNFFFEIPKTSIFYCSNFFVVALIAVRVAPIAVKSCSRSCEELLFILFWSNISQLWEQLFTAIGATLTAIGATLKQSEKLMFSEF